MQTATPPTILIVGAANTGRSPITTALLRRMLSQRGLMWEVESAGMIGYDGDPPELEARNVMLMSFAIEISDHRARSLDDNLVQNATLLVTIDRGIAHAISVRYPDAGARTVTLGALAGRERDVPDPFRMQIGAWINYAREIETLLTDGLENLIARVEELQSTEVGEPGDPSDIIAREESTTSEVREPSAEGHSAHPTTEEHPHTDAMPTAPAPDEHPDAPSQLCSDAPQVEAAPDTRHTALDRCERLLTLMHDMPDLISWENARQQLETELHAASVPLLPHDLVEPYVALIRAMLEKRSTKPAPHQLVLLQAALGRMREPIDQQALTSFTTTMEGWSEP